MRMSLQRRLAERISGYTGSTARAAELRAHLDDLADAGRPVTMLDVGSMAILAGRATISRILLDVPWWFAGLPAVLLLMMPLSLAYEIHFTAWDFIEQEPTTPNARFWKGAVGNLHAIAILTGLVAARRCVQHLRLRSFALPSLFVVMVVAAASQVNLFADRTPWASDGRLQVSHNEEVSGYSVALFAAFAMIPVVFLFIDLIWLASPRGRRMPASSIEGTIESRALIAIALPFLNSFGFLIWALPFLGLVWSAKSFSRRVKIITTVVVGLPTASLAVEAIVGEQLIGYGFMPLGLILFLPVWVRLLVDVLRPLNKVTAAGSASESVFKPDRSGVAAPSN